MSGMQKQSRAETNQPHRRRNPLTGDWVLVSPQRDQRPWQGAEETPATPQPPHDPDCYLCPGNTRVGGTRNPDYAACWVFDNDFPALLDAAPDSAGAETDPLFASAPVTGTCRVICYSPRHDLGMAQMPVAAIRDVVDTWCMQSAELAARYEWVQVFENRGAAMGCSNPHPHGQIWASDSVPNEVRKEDLCQREHFERHGTALLADYAARELERDERVVLREGNWLVVVPWWAVWPFETLLLPLQPVQRLQELDSADRDALALTLRRLLGCYDALFDSAMPFSMGWHGAPGVDDRAHWLLHAHFYPPLLRSATVRKFMVGYEMLAEAQRDMTPETAAARLRNLAGSLAGTLAG